ncbi:MAG: glycosyltransferase [Iamia sp.]
MTSRGGIPEQRGPTSAEVVAVIPVHDSEDRVGDTVIATAALPGVVRVVVVDDASADDSAVAASDAGADVVRLEVNRGKAGAIRAGLEQCRDAEVVLLLDADLGATAAGAAPLIGPVVDGEVDMTIGVLPRAGRKGGFGLIKRLSAAGIRRGCGFEARAPLSGQRAVRREVLDQLGPVERFGLEVALTIDAVRAGARVAEVEVDIDHAHTGRRVAGFRHRGRQGSDIARALWPRLTQRRTRMGLVLGLALLIIVGSLFTTPGTDVGDPLVPEVDRVVVFGVPGLGFDDVEQMPQLDRLAREGALAATNVRTGGDVPRPWAAYATLSAGVRADAIEAAAEAVGGDGRPVDVPSMADTRAAAGRYLTSDPGALGTSLALNGRSTAVVSPGRLAATGDRTGATGATLALANSGGRVDSGVIDGDVLADGDPRLLADVVAGQLEDADVVVVDPGLTAPGVSPDPPPFEDLSDADLNLAATDAVLGDVAEALPEGTLLLVVGVTPPTDEWALTATVAWGAGVEGHRLGSPTVRRPDLVTLTDIGPTVLEALGIDRPPGMAGQALRLQDGDVDRQRLEQLDDVARGREADYFRMTITFIAVQVLIQLVTWLLLARDKLRPGAARVVRGLALVGAAWPLATYLVRIVPSLMTMGAVTHLAPWPVAVAIALVASRFRRHPLAPLGAVSAATAGLIVADLATGGHLQVASVLGTAPHTTYRFNGLGNVGFAVLASTALLAVGIHVDAAPRRREALVTAGAVLGVVVVADVAPWMGADVGGILTLVPVFGLTMLALSGRRLRPRTLLIAAGLTLVGFAVVLGLDLLRPPEAQTHLARFVTETVADGDLGAALGRRWAANTRMFTQSAWTWAVLPLAIGLAVAVACSRWLRLRAPLSPSTQIVVLGALAAGILGWMLNDSGVVVTAMVLIFVPAVLTIAAMEPLRGRPTPVPRPGDPEGREALWPS